MATACSNDVPSAQTSPTSTASAVSSLAPGALTPGHIACVQSLSVLRTSTGQEYISAVLDDVVVQTTGTPCTGIAISHNTQGQLVYRTGTMAPRNQPAVTPIQPLQLDTTTNPASAFFLTQDLANELSPGGVRFVDSAAVETDSSGLHLLAGFPTAEKRFFKFYASVKVVEGNLQVCLPSDSRAGDEDSQGLHGDGDDHASTNIRVTALHNGEGCNLPAVTAPPNQVTLAGIPLNGRGFGECSNLARGSNGEYFHLTGSYSTEVGLPGYTRWPLHVMITRTNSTGYMVFVIDEASCRSTELNIVPINAA